MNAPHPPAVLMAMEEHRSNTAPHPPAVLMATVVRRSNTDDIAQCGMSRATPEATGRRHWAYFCLRIAPVATRATGKQTTINKYT